MNIQTYRSVDYYIAEFDEAEVTLPFDTWGHTWCTESDAWCEQVFGASDLWGEEPVNGWKRMRNKYFFTEEKQCEWFMLRWS